MTHRFALLGLLNILSLTLSAADLDLGSATEENLPVERASNSEPFYELEDLSVVAERYEAVGDFSLVSIQVLEAADLQRQIQSTLGETLAWEPGLNASYFGPGASRPIVRGLGDYRVRMLVNDIGTLDISDSSPDHGIPLEPLLIRRVDIHRGPDALLYGNAAIGGAINSQTRYIPESLPDRRLSGSTEARYETGAQGASQAAYGTARIGDFALRVTGALRSAGDYSIPGQARSEAYERTYNPEINNPNLGISEPIPNPSGTVPNTYIDTKTASFGALWEPDSPLGKRLGLAYSRYQSSYGVPYQYGGDANELFGDNRLDMRQSRLDSEAIFQTDLKPLERISFRFGHADYSHEENFTGKAKDADKVYQDTMMALESMEARIDLYHRFSESLSGITGVHGSARELEASRLSAPPVLSSRVGNLFETQNLGFFLLETWTKEQWTLRGGYRFEHQTIEDLSLQNFGFIRDVSQQSQSLAIGATWREYNIMGLDEAALTINLASIERLPSETERYAFWSNPAIHRFIIGADNTGTPLGVEQSNSIELGLEAHKGNWSSRLNIYSYDFKKFIFLQDIKGIGNLAQYVAKDVVFRGGEAELTWQIHRNETSALRLKGMVDWVRGHNLTGATNLPRIPPMRLGSRLEYERGKLQLGADLRYAFAQNKVQAESDVVLPELETDAYLELNFDAQLVFPVAQTEMTAFLHLKNVLDYERRSHVSFLKDVAPLPGRSLEIGMRWDF
jgi:iron complex outermembrane receptor protein